MEGNTKKKKKLSKFTYDNLRGSVVVQLTKITFLQLVQKIELIN